MSAVLPAPLAVANGFFNVLGSTLMTVAGIFYDGAILAVGQGIYAVGGTINLFSGAVSATMIIQIVQDGIAVPICQVAVDSPVSQSYLVTLAPRRVVVPAATTFRLQAQNPSQTTSGIYLCPHGTGGGGNIANPSSYIAVFPCS